MIKTSIISLAAAMALVTISTATQAETPSRGIFSIFMMPKAKSIKAGYKKTSLQSPRKTYLGRASYICSPSGFGRTSSCRLRVSYN